MLKKFFSFILIILVGVMFPIKNQASSYIWSSMEDIAISTSANVTEEYVNDKSNPLNLDCGSAILIEQTTGKVLYSYNSHEELKPASVTKIMSILLIMEEIECGKIDYETKIPCSENAASMGGSQIWLDSTELLTVNEMLKAICVVSANDCVMAMAEYIAGSEEMFVNMMNKKAQELGMCDTVFKNCHGIDEDGHVTSSYDIALMSRELLNKYPEIINYTTIWNDSLRDGKSQLVNTNKLVRNYNGCTGLKTGSTSQALFNLSASATRENVSLIAVVMKAPTSIIRFKNASTLLDYGFSNFEYLYLAKKGDVLQSVNIEKSDLDYLNVVFENDIGIVIPKGNEINIDKNIILDDVLAPIKQGEVIGKVEFKLNDEILAQVNLVAENDIDKMGFIYSFQNIFDTWFKLLRFS